MRVLKSSLVCILFLAVSLSGCIGDSSDQDKMQVELPGITRKGDTVNGYLTLSEVAAIVKKMHTITKVEPKKVSA